MENTKTSSLKISFRNKDKVSKTLEIRQNADGSVEFTVWQGSGGIGGIGTKLLPQLFEFMVKEAPILVEEVSCTTTVTSKVLL